jgi:nucleoside-diphosphate-sugar epimerase
MGKAAATHLLEMLYRTEGFPSTTLRLFLTYGPGQDASRFLPQIIKGCLENRSFPTSAGQQLRDFCYVQDVVEAVFAAFSQAAVRGETINVGSGTGVTIRQMIETVRAQIGKGEPLFGELAYRPGENMALYADVSKAKRLLGWSAKVPLEAGLNQTIQWFKDRN